MRNDGTKISKPLALLVLAGGIVFCCGVAVVPFIYGQHLNERLVIQEDTTQRLKVASAKIIETLKQQKRELQRFGQQDKFLLTGETTGIAGADLQKLVSDIAGRHKGKIQSYQLLSPEKEEKLTVISMSVTLNANIHDIQKILHEMETGTPFIFVDDIVIQAQEDQGGIKSAFQRPALDVTMKVKAYFSENRNI